MAINAYCYLAIIHCTAAIRLGEGGSVLSAIWTILLCTVLLAYHRLVGRGKYRDDHNVLLIPHFIVTICDLGQDCITLLQNSLVVCQYSVLFKTGAL